MVDRQKWVKEVMLVPREVQAFQLNEDILMHEVFTNTDYSH